MFVISDSSFVERITKDQRQSITNDYKLQTHNCKIVLYLLIHKSIHKNKMAKRKAKAKKDKPFWKQAHIVGHWLFLVGILISVVAGIAMPDKAYIASVLVFAGLAIGVLNIRADEVHSFLLATVTLIIAAQSLKYFPIIGQTAINILQYFVILVAPAATLVSIIAIYKLAKDN